MKRLNRVILASASSCCAAFLLWSVPAKAGFPISEEMTCAIGGEKFTYTTTGSYSIFGRRPDGKPFGSWSFPLALPDCPTNGLVMYRDFTDAEIDALAEFIMSPEYVNIRGETQYYRASAVARFLKEDEPYFPASLMLKASWEAEYDAELKARYQREFAEQIAALAAAPDDLDWIVLTSRAANAWRELGEFDRASAVLDQLPEEIAPPAEKRPKGDDARTEAGRDVRTRVYIDEYRKQLRKEIAAQNTESAPLAMMPNRYQTSKCLELQENAAAVQPALCTSPEMKAKVAKLQKIRAEYE